MRIDLVITELDTGGAERCCAELGLFLKRRGHSVRIIGLGPKPVPPKDALLHLVDSHHIEAHFLGGTSAWRLPSVARRLHQLVQKDCPDVVQSFLWHANVVTAAIVPRFNIPLVGGVRVAEPRRYRRSIARWASTKMAKVVCVSQSVSRWCAQYERIDPFKLVVIPNGVSLQPSDAAIDWEPYPPCEGKRLLLFVGRLEHQKGVDVLLEQVPQILKQLSEHHVVLLGDGPMRAQLAALSRAPESQGRVHCLGQRNDVRGWMQRSELLVLPTRYEGMPNVLLEAMAEGLPVVTTRVEGVAEVLGDQADLQSVAPKDWKDFLDRVVSLASDDENRKRLGEWNRQRVESHFSLEHQLAKYESLYFELMKNN